MNPLSSQQQDRLKGWLHTVRKKSARLSTRITASLGLISLTRDEEFERHYDSFKHIEKTIRIFIKNLSSFVDHFESFLLALQNTSENLCDFYRDKSHQKELAELRKRNRALACEHFHAFKRTIDRQVIAVTSQLLQKFAAPRQLIHKRSAKLLDYDTKAKEMESCRDAEKKATLRDRYVIAKEIYERINGQLIEELPMFNRIALDIFRECILVLLESRRNLILSFSKQTASLLETPLMATFTASDVASTILMSWDGPAGPRGHDQVRPNTEIRPMIEQDREDSGQTSEHDTRQSTSGTNTSDDPARIQWGGSQMSSEFDHHMAVVAREISSTPLSQVSEPQNIGPSDSDNLPLDEPDGMEGPEQAEAPTTNGFSHPEQVQHQDKPAAVEKTADIESVIEAVKNGCELEDPEEAKAEIKRVEQAQAGKDRRRKKKFQIYVASWPFVATGPNQLSIACNQPLKLIKGCDECGNAEWSLVKNKKGQLGYVPSSYIKKRDC